MYNKYRDNFCQTKLGNNLNRTHTSPVRREMFVDVYCTGGKIHRVTGLQLHYSRRFLCGNGQSSTMELHARILLFRSGMTYPGGRFEGLMLKPKPSFVQ